MLSGEEPYQAEEVRHASRNADSACPFLPSRQYKKGHVESAFRDACRTSSAYQVPHTGEVGGRGCGWGVTGLKIKSLQSM